MKTNILFPILFAISLELLVGCSDSASSSSEEKNPTLYTSVVLGKCADASSSSSSDIEKMISSLIVGHNEHSAVYLGDGIGCFYLTLYALDYCDVSADVALDFVDDTLFISYVNVQEASKCTCYSSHDFKVPSVNYRYVKFNEQVFNVVASNIRAVRSNKGEYKKGYCVENGPTHL